MINEICKITSNSIAGIPDYGIQCNRSDWISAL